MVYEAKTGIGESEPDFAIINKDRGVSEGLQLYGEGNPLQ